MTLFGCRTLKMSRKFSAKHTKQKSYVYGKNKPLKENREALI